MHTSGADGTIGEPRPQRERQRVGDAERARVGDELAEHFAAGRLSVEEFEQRAESALRAVTAHDLELLLRDLPAGPSGLEDPSAGRTAPVAPVWRSGDVLAGVVAVGCLGIGLVLLFALLGMGAPALAVDGLIGGSVAVVGGATGYHTVRRLYETRRSRGS